MVLRNSWLNDDANTILARKKELYGHIDITQQQQQKLRILTSHMNLLIVLSSYLNLELEKRSPLAKGCSLISTHTTPLCFSSTSKVADTFPTTTPFL